MAMEIGDYELLGAFDAGVQAADLTGVGPNATEAAVAAALWPALDTHQQIQAQPCTGLDGSIRRPDFAFCLHGTNGATLRVAVELKLYRNRKSGAGELDRGVGQCLAYAGDYDAVILVTVFMADNEHDTPDFWLKPCVPFVVERGQRRVPIFLMHRPR